MSKLIEYLVEIEKCMPLHAEYASRKLEKTMKVEIYHENKVLFEEIIMLDKWQKKENKRTIDIKVGAD